MKRTWKLKPEWQNRFQFDALDLANLFINATKHWYDEEDVEGMKQALFGKQDLVRSAIIDYLEKGENNVQDNRVIYALNKFQREWLGEGGKGIFHVVTLTLKEFLCTQEWAVYRVSGETRKFFGDTAFGPMWKDIPVEIEVPADLKLDSLGEVEEYLKE
jgi:hypothetical protein